MPTPAAIASSRASVTGRPRLLEPSPETSMTRRPPRNGLLRKQRHRMVDGAADRGAAAEQLARRALDRGGEGGGRFLVADQRPADHLHLQRRTGPLHHGDRDRLVRPGADGLQHPGMPERRHVSALLQLEADLIDAAGGIDREHELQVDRGSAPPPARRERRARAAAQPWSPRQQRRQAIVGGGRSHLHLAKKPC